MHIHLLICFPPPINCGINQSRTDAGDHCLCPGLYRILFAGARMSLSAFQRLFAFTKSDPGIIQNAFVAFVEHCLIEASLQIVNEGRFVYKGINAFHINAGDNALQRRIAFLI